MNVDEVFAKITERELSDLAAVGADQLFSVPPTVPCPYPEGMKRTAWFKGYAHGMNCGDSANPWEDFWGVDADDGNVEAGRQFAMAYQQGYDFAAQKPEVT